MVSAVAHKVTWQAPRPLWRGATPYEARPQILRFASDDFMEQLLATLAEEPARLSDRIARPETWRTPPQPADLKDPIVRVPLPEPIKQAKRWRLWRSAPSAPPVPPAEKPLKLYQPAHQRYYLVSGTLACQIPGLPERALEGGHERVAFVLRRFLPIPGATKPDGKPDPTLFEHAYVKAGDEARWQRVGGGTELAPGEEQLPLFPLQHHDEEGAPRTLWAGLVPVARREEYLGKPVVSTPVSLMEGQLAALRPSAPPPRTKSKYARTAQLRIEVTEPWKAMIRAAIKAGSEFEIKTPDANETAAVREERVRKYNYQFQHQSWLLLVDLRNWIDSYLPGLKARFAGNAAAGLTPNEQEVWSFLGIAKADDVASTMFPVPVPSVTMRDALQRIRDSETLLDAATTQYTPTNQVPADWPNFHFPLAGLRFPQSVVSVARAGGAYRYVLPSQPEPLVPPPPPLGDVGAVLDPPGATNTEAQGIDTPSDTAGSVPDAKELDRFTALLARALPDSTEEDVPPIPHAMKLRDVLIKTAGDQGLFVIRMVHLNEDCGPLHPPTLSAPSERFQLASFFDPEAPVRPITITLPSDTSPAGLRKHGRGAAFVMSDMLCGQVQRAKGLGFIDLVLQVLPWPFHKDIAVGDGGGCKGGGTEIGMICSLSIPIITLCALILLIIIVTLLDFIFRWLPWFITCFPVPKLKGKTS